MRNNHRRPVNRSLPDWTRPCFVFAQMLALNIVSKTSDRTDIVCMRSAIAYTYDTSSFLNRCTRRGRWQSGQLTVLSHLCRSAWTIDGIKYFDDILAVQVAQTGGRMTTNTLLFNTRRRHRLSLGHRRRWWTPVTSVDDAPVKEGAAAQCARQNNNLLVVILPLVDATCDSCGKNTKKASRSIETQGHGWSSVASVVVAVYQRSGSDTIHMVQCHHMVGLLLKPNLAFPRWRVQATVWLLTEPNLYEMGALGRVTSWGPMYNYIFFFFD